MATKMSATAILAKFFKRQDETAGQFMEGVRPVPVDERKKMAAEVIKDADFIAANGEVEIE